MAPHLRLWHTDPDGVLTTEEDAFRLTVRPPKREGGAAWFLVLRQLGTEFSIAAGGTEENIRAAMTAASFMAKLLAKEPRPLTGRTTEATPKRVARLQQVAGAEGA
jgi:hypothetical protein